jgi:hypothetical protein
MAIQNASAASLTLANEFGGSVSTASGTSVSGAATGEALKVLGVALPFSVSGWSFTLDSDSEVSFALTGGLAFSSGVFGNSSFLPPSVYSFSGATGTALLSAGSYWLAVFSGFGNVGIPYDLTISVDDDVNGVVPVPAALWLFGSAMFGLLGFTRRKA